jgi:hypothetical protein
MSPTMVSTMFVSILKTIWHLVPNDEDGKCVLMEFLKAAGTLTKN